MEDVSRDFKEFGWNTHTTTTREIVWSRASFISLTTRSLASGWWIAQPGSDAQNVFVSRSTIILWDKVAALCLGFVCLRIYHRSVGVLNTCDGCERPSFEANARCATSSSWLAHY